MKTRTIIEYLLAAMVVLILGGLAGWYFFLRTQTETTALQSAGRGFDATVPEGSANGSVLSNTEAASDSSTSPAKRPPQLWRVEAKPVAGQLFVGSSSAPRLRYVDRASGYVLEANPETGDVTRLTNTLMPKIYEALLSENGHVFERSLDATSNVTTFAGTISTSTDAAASSSAQVLSGAYLAENIRSMGVNPSTGTLFYLLENSRGVIGVSADWNGAKQKTIFESIITNWRPMVLRDGRVVLAQSAADNVPGYAYEVRQDGTLIPLAGPVLGLTLRAREGAGTGSQTALLWSQSARGELRLFAQVNADATPVQLPVRTIADKCAWAEEGELIAYCGVPQGQVGQTFLDDWYRGVAHSSDGIWRVDARAGTAELLFTPPSNVSLDIENVSVDRSHRYIAFTNAADKSLWIFRISQ